MITAVRETDELAARAELRRQIAVLEARGGKALGIGAGPRLLSLGELEATRDALAAHRTSISSRHAVGIRTFEAMLADPGAHRGAAISLRELGRPGCGVYRVKPRCGLLGRLMNWWRVVLSSGCP